MLIYLITFEAQADLQLTTKAEREQKKESELREGAPAEADKRSLAICLAFLYASAAAPAAT